MSGEVRELLLQLPTMVVVFSAIPLGASLVIGFICGVLQAATQIQEQSLVYLPKLIGLLVVAVICGPAALVSLLEYWSEIFDLLSRL